MPTATISSAPFSNASSSAMSSLIPVAADVDSRRRAASSLRAPGAAPSAVRVDDAARHRSGARRPRRSPCRRRSRRASYPASSSASAPPSTPTSTGLKSRTYGRTIREIALVAGPSRDDERVSFSETRLERREVDALARAAGPPRVGSASCSRRSASSASVTRPRCSASARVELLGRQRRGPFARHVPLRKRPAPRTVTTSPSCTSSNSVSSRRRRSAGRRPARAASGPGFGKRPVCDGATLTTTRTPDSTSSSAETRSRSCGR